MSVGNQVYFRAGMCECPHFSVEDCGASAEADGGCKDWLGAVVDDHAIPRSFGAPSGFPPGAIRVDEDVEQTRGQRQTGRNDLPGKGERVASGW